MAVMPNNFVLTITSSAQALASQATYATSVYFEADPANLGDILIGDWQMTTSRYIARIAPGKSFTINVDTGQGAADRTYGPCLNIAMLGALGLSSGDKIYITTIDFTGIV